MALSHLYFPVKGIKSIETATCTIFVFKSVSILVFAVLKSNFYIKYKKSHLIHLERWDMLQDIMNRYSFEYLVDKFFEMTQETE